MSSVGAFQGKGGYQEHYQYGLSSDFQVGSEQDSYLGEKHIKLALHLFVQSKIK